METYKKLTPPVELDTTNINKFIHARKLGYNPLQPRK